jgi:hypothetical protein
MQTDADPRVPPQNAPPEARKGSRNKILKGVGVVLLTVLAFFAGGKFNEHGIKIRSPITITTESTGPGYEVEKHVAETAKSTVGHILNDAKRRAAEIGNDAAVEEAMAKIGQAFDRISPVVREQVRARSEDLKKAIKKVVTENLPEKGIEETGRWILSVLLGWRLIGDKTSPPTGSYPPCDGEACADVEVQWVHKQKQFRVTNDSDRQTLVTFFGEFLPIPVAVGPKGQEYTPPTMIYYHRYAAEYQ